LSLLATHQARAETSQILQQEEKPEQVVITATQRTVPAVDVPSSVSVLNAERLAGAHVETVKQLTSLTPTIGVVNSIGESFGQLITVRGIATSGADIGLESAVGISLDGVPLSRPNLAIFDLQGIDRIEFLRGPQGTLFGMNTTAGIINVLTRRPAFEPHFEVSGTLGNRAQKELRVTAEGGIVPTKLAARIDALHGTIDGYLRNPNSGIVYGGRHRDQVRGQLLFVPSDAVEVRIIADYLHHGGTVNSPVYRVVGPTGALIGSLGGFPLLAFNHATDIAQIDNDAPRFEFSDSAGATAEANWQSGIGTFTALTSYRSSTMRRSYDVDNSPADIANDPRDGERFNNSVLELRLQGVAQRLDYLFGAHLGHDLISSRDSYTLGTDFEPYLITPYPWILSVTGLPFGSNYPAGSGVLDVFSQRSTNFALFTHQIFAVTDRLSLSAGLRYTQENKSLMAQIASNNPGCSSALSGPVFAGLLNSQKRLICIPNLDPRYDGNYATERREGNWSGTAAASERFFEFWNAYVSYSRGYKGGGFQLDRSGMDPLSPSLSQLAFEHETADSFEGGIKGADPNGRWRTSTAVFYTRFSNYQFSYFTGYNRRTRNVPELVTKGVETENAYRPFGPLELSFSGIYQEVVFGDSGFPASLIQLQGTTAPIAPRWVLVGAAAYEQPLDGLGVTAFGNIDIRWQSKSNVGASATPSPAFAQDPYAVVGARIGVETAARNWKVELWARNLFNQRAWSLLNSTTLQPGSISGFVSDPRSWGITVTAAW
jgi:outer membrane receptor protein involved in Fe transport